MREEAVRGVLALFAAGLLSACGAGGEKSTPALAPADVENGAMRVYVGTYTGGASRGIYLLELDRSSGRFVSGPALAGETENPSFLALHPNGRFLYAVNELKTFEGKPTGTVSAFSVDPATGHLTFLNRQVSEGTDPCWVVVDAAGKNVLVANYTSGTVAVLPLSADGRLQPASSVRHGSGSGPVRARQEGPHAHTVVLDAASRFALWTDLGADRVRVDRFDAAAGTLEPNDPDGLAVEPGSGPRHLAWHPSGRAVYVLGELNATVSTLGFDAGRGSLELAQTLPARADGASAENTAAEIAVSPDGRFLYTSNRGDDDLAVFAIDGASLRLAPAGRVPSGGRGPRSFALDPSGRWLVTANQGSGSLVVFRRDPATGLPAAAGAPVAVPEPVCVLFSPEGTAP
jgi:6-phosphogluconolactonase